MKGNFDLNQQSQRYRLIDQNNIDYVYSEHALATQDSKYIKIENNRERIYRQTLRRLNITNSNKNKGRDGCNL